MSAKEQNRLRILDGSIGTALVDAGGCPAPGSEWTSGMVATESEFEVLISRLTRRATRDERRIKNSDELHLLVSEASGLPQKAYFPTLSGVIPN